MASRGCKHPADAFCYVCGQFIKQRAKKYSVEVSAKMCEAYNAYFGMPVGDQDKPWAPHVSCEYCKKTLEGKVVNITVYVFMLHVKLMLHMLHVVFHVYVC